MRPMLALFSPVLKIVCRLQSILLKVCDLFPVNGKVPVTFSSPD
uniref:Uncharacterized protein n=1 Tax=Anguilla anguilla TaxID=7936 RepID=A0A0E9VPY8_ANGAN